MEISCRNCQASFILTDEDRNFLKKLSPSCGGNNLSLPPPTLCPECRQLRRLSFNNETKLYHRRCDLTNEPIISIISADKPYTVYKMSEWWGESWDGISYGREFDFSKTFFEQFQELHRAIPHAALRTNYVLDENSAYTNYAGSNKNCYLLFHADFNRDCYYGYGVKKCESCIDVLNVFDSELCYECIDCRQCYNLQFSQDCVTCQDSLFLERCIGCKNCLGCKNLQQKQYCIFNKQYSKAEYERLLTEYNLHSRAGRKRFQEQFEKFAEDLPNRFLQMIQTENSLGDYLYNCRNVQWSYNVSDMFDGRYCYQVYNNAKDCMDMYQFGLQSELIYEGSIIGYNAQRVLFSHLCSEQISDLLYCQECHHSSHLFGCVGLKRNQYCILNKEYSREEYESLLPKVIAHLRETKEWGEFFPSALSMYGYNETTAMDFMPLTKKAALKGGFKWHEEEEAGEYVGGRYESPDTISLASDEITQKVITCASSGKLYKIIPPELAFYQKENIPPPDRSPEQRYRDRLSKKNPRQLRKTQCDNCSVEIYTSQMGERVEKVYCEKCYLESLN